MMKKVHIIGGGIIGASIAYHLSDQAQVAVFEKDALYSQSSFARSCGGLRSQYSTATNILMSRYSIDFIKSKTDVAFTPNGYLMLFGYDQKSDHDASIVLQANHNATTHSLTPGEILHLHPYLNVDDVYRGCTTLDGTEGWIDPTTLHTWFRTQAQQKGAKFMIADGTTVDHDSADAVIIASGCWSGEVGKHFGLEIPVQGHKHTVFYVSTEKPQISTLPLVADLITGVYLRPEGKNYIVGFDGNGEWGADNLDPDLRTWDHVWELLYHRFPEHFDAARMTGAWSGYYDSSTIDNNAIIDCRSKYYFATGFTGRGLMHSPAVGLVVSEMVLDKPTSFDISAYKLDRIPDVEKYVI
jgi:FAD-dependent oxidoreductase domain-containing protein 1